MAQQVDPGVFNAMVVSLAETINSAFVEIQSNADFSTAGKTIAFGLAALVLAWNLVKAMINGEGINGLIVALIPLFGSLAIVYALIDSGGMQKIIGFMDSVAGALGASQGLAADVDQAIRKGFAVVSNIMRLPGFRSSTIGFDVSSILQVVITSVLVLFAKLIAAILVTIAILLYVANIVLAHGSIMLAVALGPLMVPFLISPATNFLFDGWLRFLISSGMVKIVGTFMIAFTDKLMSQLVALSEKMAPISGDVDIFAQTPVVIIFCCALILLAGLCAYFMLQVPSLANGMVRGVGGSGIGFNFAAIRTSGK